jgi:hypothetical protein
VTTPGLAFDIFEMNVSFGSSPVASTTENSSPKSQKAQQQTPLTSPEINFEEIRNEQEHYTPDGSMAIVLPLSVVTVIDNIHQFLFAVAMKPLLEQHTKTAYKINLVVVFLLK